ncbi:MAG: HAD family hydrolase [Planctomycetes bacterium]|nr:HAD family hydrolase [Planctomycetota bacterium]
MTRPRAVFLDRDNTLIADPGFIRRPEQVQLLPGAAQAVRRFRAAGYRVVVVTNQSGVARGLLTEDQLQAVHDRLRTLLRAQGAELDAIYYCPHLDGPEAKVASYRRKSPLRKPEPGMLLAAAADHQFDLARSWMIGDSERDMEAGRRAGCRSVLLIGSNGSDADSHEQASDGRPQGGADYTAKTLSQAADIVEDNEPMQDEPNEEKAEQTQLLTEIRDLLESQTRRGSQEDFSFRRLCASIAQMFAIVVCLWGVLALADQDSAAATARFVLAVFLQLATIAAWLADHRR